MKHFFYNRLKFLTVGLKPVGAWNIANSLNTMRQSSAGCGKQNEGLCFGGYNSDWLELTSTEEYNGLTWSSGGNLVTGRGDLGGCGSQNAALSFGGAIMTDPTNKVESYNGTSWSNVANLSTARQGVGGCGSQNAALAVGGLDLNYMIVDTSEKFNGTTWSSATGTLNVGRQNFGCCGLQDEALAIAGYSDYGYPMNCEEYNGTTWTIGGELPYGVSNIVACGQLNEALCFGGRDDYGNPYNSTFEYNGAAFTEIGTMIIATTHHSGFGMQSQAVSCGGKGLMDLISQCQEYNKFLPW